MDRAEWAKGALFILKFLHFLLLGAKIMLIPHWDRLELNFAPVQYEGMVVQ